MYLYYCTDERMYVCTLPWIISISSMSWIVLSTYLPVYPPTLSCYDLPCPALSWIALFVLYVFFFLPCPVLSLALSCLALPCPVLDWGCLACCVILSFLPCLALPCLALLVADLVSSPESACLSALPCRVFGLALPCLVCYLDLSCLALSCLVWYLDLSCLALSCVALRGLALPCLFCRSRYIDASMLTTIQYST